MRRKAASSLRPVPAAQQRMQQDGAESRGADAVEGAGLPVLEPDALEGDVGVRRGGRGGGRRAGEGDASERAQDQPRSDGEGRFHALTSKLPATLSSSREPRCWNSGHRVCNPAL